MLLMMILGPLAAGLIQLAVSRSREYEADASGARLTGDPLALASALRKLDDGHPGSSRCRPSRGWRPTSHLMIANPFRAGDAVEALLHPPPMAERIARLERWQVTVPDRAPPPVPLGDVTRSGPQGGHSRLRPVKCDQVPSQHDLADPLRPLDGPRLLRSPGIICCVLIIDIPFGIAAFRIAGSTPCGPSAAPRSNAPTPGAGSWSAMSSG